MLKYALIFTGGVLLGSLIGVVVMACLSVGSQADAHIKEERGKQ